MNNTLYLFVGPSGSGKTTMANALEEICLLQQLQSYTTRLPRYKDEIGHIFVTNDEFDELTDIVAYTEYNGNRYCATKDQIDESDIYVVDVPGVQTLLEKYNSNRDIVVLYFNVDEKTRIARMAARQDSAEKINERIQNDGLSDWYEDLKQIVFEACRDNVDLISVPAYKCEIEVIDFILDCINERSDLF